ncbi:MAG: hypothetical protein RLZZ380_100 [Actinomycetota bacterium]|jgi:hypothetical protein
MSKAVGPLFVFFLLCVFLGLSERREITRNFEKYQKLRENGAFTFYGLSFLISLVILFLLSFPEDSYDPSGLQLFFGICAAIKIAFFVLLLLLDAFSIIKGVNSSSDRTRTFARLATFDSLGILVSFAIWIAFGTN